METGKLIDRIEQPRSISDHPMLIFAKDFYIEKKNTNEAINILDKYTIKENYENLIKYIIDITKSLQLKNPNIIKHINSRQTHIDNLNYIDEYNQIKENDKITFKEIQKSTAKEISDLVKCNNLGKEPYQRLLSLIHYKSKIVWWRPESKETFQHILQGAKELYIDQGPIQITKHKLAELINKIIDKMLKSNDINSLPPPDTPKITAKDKCGFNQKI